jgi:hypothetical protein
MRKFAVPAGVFVALRDPAVPHGTSVQPASVNEHVGWSSQHSVCKHVTLAHNHKTFLRVPALHVRELQIPRVAQHSELVHEKASMHRFVGLRRAVPLHKKSAQYNGLQHTAVVQPPSCNKRRFSFSFCSRALIYSLASL